MAFHARKVMILTPSSREGYAAACAALELAPHDGGNRVWT